MIQVWYHANCNDGFAAALVCWKHFKGVGKYIPVQYKEPHPPVAFNDVIYIVDFSYPRDVLTEINSIAQSLTVLDHHKTAEEELRGLEFCRFEQTKSGCQMAWDWFFGGPTPRMLELIQDRDLWLWELPETAAFAAGIAREPREFGRWSAILEDLIELRSVILSGQIILDYQRTLIKAAVENARIEPLSTTPYEVPTVNTTVLISEIGHALLEKFPDAPFVMMYFDTADKRICFLRSRKDFDCSAVAKAFGGGGHAQASGFSLPRPRAISP